MNKKTHRELMETMLKVGIIGNPEKRGDCEAIHRAAKSLHRLYELACNGYPKPVIEHRDGKVYRYDVEDEALRARCEKRETSLEKKIADIAERNGWQVEIQGDPRGWPVKLTIDGKDASFLVNY